MSEYLLVGWKQIAELLKDRNGKQVISLSTLTHKYGPEMKRLGYVFEFNIGRAKRLNICAWPSQVKKYFIIKQQKGSLKL